MIPRFEDLSYEALRILRHITLEERRNSADLILLFKMYNYKELSRPPVESLQVTNQDKTRGHTLKLI